MFVILLALALGTGGVVLCGCSRAAAMPIAPEPGLAQAAAGRVAQDEGRVPATVTDDSTTLVEMRNVHFRLGESVSLRIHELSGEMIPRGRPYIWFDDARGYVIRIRSAEVGMRPASLQALLSNHVFNYPDAPITINRIAIRDTLLIQEGVLHKIVDIPFEMAAIPSVTEAGLIRLHPIAMRICSIPGKGLMDALGIELGDLLDLAGAEGVSVDGNDLLLDPERVLPPPAIQGRLTEIRLADGELIQTLGPDPDSPPIRQIPEPPSADSPNYMFYHGGTIRFGDLMLIGSELQIVDADTSDIFDFNLYGYRPQLLAGYSEATQSLGQITHMPDYDDVADGRVTRLEPADSGSHVGQRRRRQEGRRP